MTKSEKQNAKTENETNCKFRTQFTDYHGTKGEDVSQASITVPDMSLTIRELVYNHSRGIGIDVYQPAPQYFDREIPRINDLTDLEAFREENSELLKETTRLTKKVQEEEEKAAKMELEAKLRKQIEAEQEAARLNFTQSK